MLLISISSSIIPFNLSKTTSTEFKVGAVSEQDVQAPYSLAYSSQVLTELAKIQSRQNTLPVYLPTDNEIGLRQIRKAQYFLDLIKSLRIESELTDQEKLDEIYHSNVKPLPIIYIKQLLSLSNEEYYSISNEVIRLLRLAYKETIRDIDLQRVKSSIFRNMDPTLSNSFSNLVYGITSPFIITNSFYSEEKTLEEMEINASEVKPIIKSYLQGETLVERGQVITPEIYESLEVYKLVEVQNPDLKDVLSSTALTFTIFGSIWLYLLYQKPKTFDQLRNLTAILILFVIFLLVSRFVIPGRTIIPYVLPVPAFALTIASSINPGLALLFSFALSIMIVFGLENALFLLVYYSLSSFIGVLVLGRGSKISHFFLSGLFITVFGMLIITVFYLPQPHSDLVGFVTLCGASIFYGFASAGLTLILQYGTSRLLGIPTALQLIEISRPDHPLLQFILRNAPGTYQHSLQVANLAEQVAENIGADPILTRVGALYHDAGKSINPFYFIENQIPGEKNPHNNLLPVSSSKIIIRHVHDGIMLAKKYHLPTRLLDFILEHHGTSITKYQYGSAIEKSKEAALVNPDDFRYPGPSPRSKETAILMIADGCEAKARAILPKTQEEIHSMVKNVVEQYRSNNQFDHTNLTMADFSKIIETLTNALVNTYHPRLDYPEITDIHQK